MLTHYTTKLLYFCLLLLAGNVSAQALQRGLLFYAPFDGNTISLVDWVKPVNHGVSLTEDKFGRLNRAIFIDEQSDDLVYGTIPKSRGENFSISCWIRPDRGDGQNSATGIDGLTTLSQLFNVLPTIPTQAALPALKVGTWQHLVLMRDENNLQYCLDGNCSSFYLASNEAAFQNSTTFTLGGNSFLSPASFFYGALDEIRIYDRRLSEREIEMLYRDFQGDNQPSSFAKQSVATPELSIFPNPTSRILKVRFSAAASRSVEITDAAGRNMSYGKYTESEISINVSGFPPGTYFLRIKGEAGLTVRQFVKQGIVLP